MTQMINGLKKLFSGSNALHRQISFFSICGIAGLLNGYFALETQGLIEVSIYQKVIFATLLTIFGLFFIGFEILFMHDRMLPDVDISSFIAAVKKIPFLIFLITLPFLLISLFTKYQYTAFCIETVISIPLTMIQAGFSYNYRNNEAGLLFKKFRVKEYFMLLIKKLWIVIAAHIVTFIFIFLIFFVIGITAAVSYKWNVGALSLAISSQQTTIAKLSNYITSILLIYTLSIGTLVWDYEMLKMYEDDEATSEL